MKKKNKYLDELMTQLEDSRASASESGLADFVERPRFAQGFADRVLERLENGALAQNFEHYLPRMFRWVAVGGVAAAIALVVLTWYQQDALTLDAFTGLADVAITDDLALNSF